MADNEAETGRGMSKDMRIEIGGEPHGPLAGIKVVDLSTIVSGPLCAQALGDLGADVVKVEAPPIGDTARIIGGIQKAGMTGFFAQFNRNKRSVKLDLKNDKGRDALLALIDSADVLIPLEVENLDEIRAQLGQPRETVDREGNRLRVVMLELEVFGDGRNHTLRLRYERIPPTGEPISLERRWPRRSWNQRQFRELLLAAQFEEPKFLSLTGEAAEIDASVFVTMVRET